MSTTSQTFYRARPGKARARFAVGIHPVHDPLAPGIFPLAPGTFHRRVANTAHAIFLIIDRQTSQELKAEFTHILLALAISQVQLSGSPNFPEVRILFENASVFSPCAATPVSEGCQNLAPSRKWFAVYTRSRHEKRAALHLLHREIPHYLPLYRAGRNWKNCAQVELDLPLFPGYVFVNVSSCERVRALQVPGVVTMVGGVDGRPASISDHEIESLRAALHHRRAQPHTYLAAGQRVRIRSGALSGLEGKVIRIKNGFRVVLSLDLIRQSFSVEVQREELELLESESRTVTSAA